MEKSDNGKKVYRLKMEEEKEYPEWLIKFSEVFAKEICKQMKLNEKLEEEK